ncbi:unnamed protein product [Callosobruchus maculatus]|uniref:Peroxisomal membrane protein PEX14 n=1 Tax=Callosobruchus maculatus TaxID=64391 RepID=A0A653CJX4_CALMS|nr:unnamed protein product [Callosobruchus maculatus]
MAAAVETPVSSQIEGPVREEMVQTAINFLENPNVINTPLAQKQNFLRRKGLTDKEIQIACDKSGAYTRHEEQQRRLPPPLSTSMSTVCNHPMYGQMQLSWFDRIREILHNLAILSIVAYVVQKFYQKYIAPFLFGKKKKSVEETIEELDKNVKSSVGEIKDDLQSVKVEVDRLNGDNTSRQLAELKSDIATVKGLLLGRKQFPSVASCPVVPPSIPAWQMSSVTQDEHDGEERKEDLEELGSGSGSSEHEHGMKTSESSLEIISSKDCDSESCHSRKSHKDDNEKE